MRAVLCATLILVLNAFGLVACQSEATYAPTPTPTPIPEEMLAIAAEKMETLQFVAFALTHEQGRTPLMAGIEAEKVEGIVALPNEASLQVEAIVTSMRLFVSIEIVVKGVQAYMTDPLSGVWRQLPADSLPFNAMDLGRTMADISRSVQNPVFTSTQDIEGILSRGIQGSVSGQELVSLIPLAVPSNQVDLELWVGEDDFIRRVRILGPVVAQDSPEVIRVLSFTDFDQPVTISVPR